MRKVILSVAVSLDGYIEGPNGEYDWCATDQDYGFTSFMDRIDTILFGRRSYEMMLTAGDVETPVPDPFKNYTRYVFSNTLSQVQDGYQLVNTELGDAIDQIKKNGQKDIWLFGGADLLTSMINLNLVDQLNLAVHPILLGKGKHLFKDLQSRIGLRLIDSEKYDTGLVLLTYKTEVN